MKTAWLEATPLTQQIEAAQAELLLAMTREAAARAQEEQALMQFEDAAAALERARHWHDVCRTKAEQWFRALADLKLEQAKADRDADQDDWPEDEDEDTPPPAVYHKDD